MSYNIRVEPSLASRARGYEKCISTHGSWLVGLRVGQSIEWSVPVIVQMT